MADNLEDGEFWLPPLFLSDSDPDSSSATGSTYGDGDDFDDSLTLSTPSPFPFSDLPSSKGWAGLNVTLSTSPKSTLCGWPNIPVTHPEDSETLNLLNKAAGEVARVNQSTDTPVLSGTGFFDCASKSPSSFLPPHFYRPSPFPPFYQQLVWGQVKPASGPLGLPPNAWPPLKPTNHGRATPTPIRECVGTGVFLPRAVPTETRKKTDANGKDRSQQQKNSKSNSNSNSNSCAVRANQTEIQLPQEWTY